MIRRRRLRKQRDRIAVAWEHAPSWMSEEGEQLAADLERYLGTVDDFREQGIEPSFRSEEAEVGYIDSPLVQRLRPYLSDCDPGDEDDGWRRAA